MTVRYRSTEDDARRSYYDDLRRKESTAKVRLSRAVLILIGAGFLLMQFRFMGLLQPTDPPWRFLVGYGIAAVALWGVLAASNRFAFEYLFKQQLRQGHYSKMIGELEVTLSEDGITEAYPNGSIVTAWPGVESVAREDDSLRIKLESQYFHVIPWSAFASPEEAEAFAAYAEDRCAAHCG